MAASCAHRMAGIDVGVSVSQPELSQDVMGVFAEFERAMIQERVKAGLQRAKAQGKVLGRPSTQLEKVEAIKAGLRAGSVGIIKLAKLHGVGVGTVQRIKAALAA